MACRWCGRDHGLPCPWVRAVEFNWLGAVRRVEFLTPSDMGQPAKQPPAPPEEPQADYPRLGQGATNAKWPEGGGRDRP